MPRSKLLPFLSALLAAILLFTIPASADLSSAFGMGKAVLVPVDMNFLLPADCTVKVPSSGAFGYSAADLENIIRSGLSAAQVLSVSPAGNVALACVSSGDEEYLLACSDGQAALVYPGRAVPELSGLEDGDGKPAGENFFSLTFKGFSSANRLDNAGLIWSADGRYFCPLSRWAMQDQLYARRETVWMHKDDNGAMSGKYNPAYVMDLYYVVDTGTGEAFAVDFFRPSDETSVMWLDACFSHEGDLVVVGCGNVFGEQPAETIIRAYDLETGKKKETGIPEEIMPEGIQTIPSITELQEDSESGQWNSRFIGITSLGRDIPQRCLRFGPDSPEEAGTDEIFFLGEISTPAKAVETSSASGFSLVLAETEESPMSSTYGLDSGLLRIRAAEWNQADWNTLWVIPEGETKLIPMNAEEVKTVREANREVMASARKNRRGGNNTQATGTIQRYMNIAEMELSPDGEYAVVLAMPSVTRKPDEAAEVTALLVHLSDMECVPIEGLEFGTGTEAQKYLNGLDAYMEWTEAGILVTAGESRLYRFEEPGL